MNDHNTVESKGVISGMVHKFLTSQLTIILIIFSLSVSFASVIIAPREEDPQIVVPLADVFVQYPGASAEEVEKLGATPLDRLLWQIDGVAGWVNKPVEIDDVPIVNPALYSGRYDEHQLRRIGEERMAGLSVSALEIHQALRGADASITAGTYSKSNREFTVSSDAFIAIAGEVERLVGGCTREGRSILKTSPQL